MTLNERADACLEVPTLPDGSIDWGKADISNNPLPFGLRERILAHLRAAVAEEREACAGVADQVEKEHEYGITGIGGRAASRFVANRIRARGEP